MSGRRNSLSRAAWAARLAGKLRKRAGLVFEVGDELVQAKAELAHGEWLPLLGDVGISSRHAQRFMRIARSKWLRKYATGAHLPDDLPVEEIAQRARQKLAQIEDDFTTFMRSRRSLSEASGGGSKSG